MFVKKNKASIELTGRWTKNGCMITNDLFPDMIAICTQNDDE